MIVVTSYPVAVALCTATMLCWGSWANMRKLASHDWPFQLFYWDYSIGVLLLALILAFTLGSFGGAGRAFLSDLLQADARWLGSAFLGGVLFNLSNILLVAAIDVAGLAVAFPIGVGLALALGVVTTYLSTRSGNVRMLAAGVALVLLAVLLDGLAYRRLASEHQTSRRGIALSVTAGVLMGWFYSFVAQSIGAISPSTEMLEHAKLSPYTALVLFSLGLFASNFLWNSLVMARPFTGPPVSYRDYVDKGTIRLHVVGVAGGVIWNLGMALNLLASTEAGAALSYGLGQGATMIAAIWGVFVWKEFAAAHSGTRALIASMFACYLAGLVILVVSRI